MNMDAPFLVECCSSTNTGALFPSESCTSTNIDTQFATKCCSSANFDALFPSECCTSTNIDAPFPAEYCTPTNMDIQSHTELTELTDIISFDGTLSVCPFLVGENGRQPRPQWPGCFCRKMSCLNGSRKLLTQKI